MFTGLIESLGRVVDVSDAPAGKRLRVKPETPTDLTSGESVAVNGVCLTVVEYGDARHCLRRLAGDAPRHDARGAWPPDRSSISNGR